MKAKGLLIFGATELARLAHYYATRHAQHEVLGFIVDREYLTSDTLLDLPVYCWDELTGKFDPDYTCVHVSIGYNNFRLRLDAYEKVQAAGYELPNIIEPSSFIADDAKLGANNIIMPGVVIEPGVIMGSNNVVWSNATICHDSAIGSHNFIASNVTVGGGVEIGDQNFLGFSSVVSQGRCIGSENIVGAASLVLSDLQSLTRYYGAPAIKVGTIDPATGVTIS